MLYWIFCMIIIFYFIICLYKDRYRVNLVKKEFDVIIIILKYIIWIDILCVNVIGFILVVCII